MAYGRSGITGSEYGEMDSLALSVLQDYNIFTFPIDVFEIAIKYLHIKIVPYSQLSEGKRAKLFSLLTEKNYADVSKGFTIFEKMSDGTVKHTIYYNDSLNYNECRYTIAHEIKHILLKEDKPTSKQEDLAEYFAKVFIAPKAVAIHDNITDAHEIEYRFELTECASSFLSIGLANRIQKKGKEFFEPFEQEYLSLRNEYLNKINYNKDGDGI